MAGFQGAFQPASSYLKGVRARFIAWCLKWPSRGMPVGS